MRTAKLIRESKGLRKVAPIECNAESLASLNLDALMKIYASADIATQWDQTRARLTDFALPDGTGGVNPGDRRAIYYLIRGLKPASVLEIGTHIGASTVHIASALALNALEGGTQPELTSVDIANVNDADRQPWRKHGASHSPAAMLEQTGALHMVEFVTSPALDYLANCDRKYDFIFLDGDHKASAVYQEIPAALTLLNAGGTILLHDVYPGLKALWSDGFLIPGPILATDRLKSEGVKLKLLPLGELPWPTKLQSNVTSLALLSRAD